MPSKHDTSTIYDFDGFRVDTAAQTLSQGGKAVPLTPKVFEMLTVFLEKPGELLSKEELMERLWPETFVEEANLAQNVAVLRRALGDSSRAPKYIVTLPGRGYRFIGDVRNAEANGVGPIETKAPDKKRIERVSGKVKFGMATLGFVLFAVALWFIVRPGETARNAMVTQTSQITAWSGLDFYPSLAPDGRSIAFCSDRSGRLEIFTRQLLQGAREIQVTSDGGQNCQPAFSPDGTQIAYASHGARPGIYVVPSAGGAARRISTFGTRPAWSPDGAQIAFQSDPLNDLGSNVRNAMPPSTLWLVPVASGEPRQLTRPGEPPGGHGAPSWSPDGKRIVFDVNDWAVSEVWTVSLDDGSATPLNATTRSESDPIYAPDGKSIYYVSDTGSAVQNVGVSADGKATGEPLKVLDASGTRVRQLSIDRGGARLVYATLSTTSNIWMTPVDARAAAPAEPVPLTKHAHSRTVLPAFSPDGRLIAYQSFKTGSLAHLWLMNPDGTEQRQLSSRPAFNPTWSADGATIWFLSPGPDGTSYWSVDPNSGLEKRLFDFDEAEVFGARAAPDGSLVVFNSKRSGTPNVWALPLAGGEPRQITFDKEFAGFPAFSPDGRWLAVQVKRGTNTHVGVMPAGGGEIVQLTNGKGQAWVNGWAGDNDKIVFAGQQDGIWNVYSVSRTTREIGKLTDFTKLNEYVRYPSISPAGDKVAYEFAVTTGNVWMVEFK